MIRIAGPFPPDPPAWHKGFMAMLPAILNHARVAFRHLRPEARGEAVQEVVCNAMAAYAALVKRGKVALAYPSILARFAVAQTRDHRKVGGHLNCKDVSFPYCQRLRGIVVERLDHFDKEENAWTEAVVEDRTAGPAEIARTRIDFEAWFEAPSPPQSAYRGGPRCRKQHRRRCPAIQGVRREDLAVAARVASVLARVPRRGTPAGRAGSA